MNTLKNVYKKIQQDKTELKSEKIELAIADRAIKFTNDLEKGNRNFMTDYMSVIEEAIKKGEKELNRLGAVYRLAKKTEKTLIEEMKALGVSKSPVLDNLNKQIDRYENYVVKQSRKYF